MKKLSLVLSILMSVCVVTAYAGAKKKANKDTDTFRYDIEYAKTAANGMVMVKVWSYSKKSNVAIEQCKKNAVHGVIFKGYTGSTGTISQSPLAKDPGVYSQKQEFFDSFFANGGNYMKYVSGVASGQTEVRKVGKEYKIGEVITVNKDLLRKDLEAAGIIKGLTSGF